MAYEEEDEMELMKLSEDMRERRRRAAKRKLSQNERIQRRNFLTRKQRDAEDAAIKKYIESGDENDLPKHLR